MKEIKAGKSMVLVDDELFGFLSNFKWRIQTKGYAVNKRLGLMHRLINKTEKGKMTDHINGNKLDNRKENLRTATVSQNAMNRGADKDGKYGLKGITHIKKKGKVVGFVAKIGKGKVYKYLGFFKTKEDAKRAYDLEAMTLHQEFAKL